MITTRTTGRRSFSQRFLFLTMLLAAFLLNVATAIAQTSGTGSIQGTITDPSGAALPNATVSALNTTTGVVTESKSNGSGSYKIPLLKPGNYNVTITGTSFAPVTEKDVTVDALSAIAINVKLSKTVTTESVTVTGEQGGLQTEDLRLGSNMDNETYDALPIAQDGQARDPTQFVSLAVGVNNFQTQAAGTSLASFNGGQTYQNETYFEGLPLTSGGTEGDTRPLAFGVSVEAIEQFQVAVTGSEATYEGQGVSNFVVKSGGSKYHGGIYEFFRNTIFDSKNFFATRVIPDHQNEYGGSFSGPVPFLKDKLFFFVNYDGYRYITNTQPVFQTIPTLAERAGDFSATGFNPIYDPNTCLTTNASGACTSRQQFSYNGVLNVIDPARLSPVSKSLQSYLPAPTTSALTSNYLAQLPYKVNNDSGTGKIDYVISSKHRMSAIFTRGKYANPITGSLTQGNATQSALPDPYIAGRTVLENTMLGQLHESWQIGSNKVNDFGFGFNRLYVPLVSNTAGGNYPSKAGLKGLPAGIASTAFPETAFGGTNNPVVGWGGTNARVNTEAQTSYTVQDNFLWTVGKHQMTIGYQYQTLQDNFNNPLSGTQANFAFAQDQTANFTSAAAINTSTGNSYASYLLGAVSSSSVVNNSVIETGGRYKTNAGYFQDNIKINPGLTINVGLRYDVWSPFKEVLNRQTFFDPNAVNPVAGNRLGALKFSGSGNSYNCNCDTPVDVKYKLFGPRIGLAQKLGDKAVIRAAYGILYGHAGAVGGRVNGRQGLSQIGFNNSGAATSTVTGQPAYFWDNGVPGNILTPPFFNPSYGIGFILATAPGAAAIGSGPGTAQTLSYADTKRDGMPPQYQNFFLNLQYELPKNNVVSAAYSGSVGRYLPGAGVADQFTNQIPLQYLVLGSLLTQTLNTTTQAQALALGVNVPTPFANFTGTIGQALKPYPQYNGISNPWRDVGKSSYNSLQMTFNHRSPKGLSYMVNYTFSKEMDDLAGLRLPGSLSLEYSVGALYRRHVVQSTVVYNLPFGQGRQFNPSNGIVRAVVSGYSFGAIVTGASGAPLSVTSTCTGGGIIDASCYPNLNPAFTGPVTNDARPHTVADANVGGRLATAAFTAPAAYTYGNAPRTAPYGLFAPHTTNFDANFRREFAIYESVKFLFQADCFNVLNRPYFASPAVSSTTPATFGAYSSTSNKPRKYQFSARISF